MNTSLRSARVLDMYDEAFCDYSENFVLFVTGKYYVFIKIRSSMIKHNFLFLLFAMNLLFVKSFLFFLVFDFQSHFSL